MPDLSGSLDGMPCQRGSSAKVPDAPDAPDAADAPDAPDAADAPDAPDAPDAADAPTVPVAPVEAPAVEPSESRRRLRPWRLLPTPTGTPFTFGYAAVLTVTSLITAYADPALVHALHQGSSTDVAHLVQTPALVLTASALWIAGGILSPYAVGFLVVLTALERRTGGLCTAGVFILGHVLATLATEVPVGLAVLAGHLPDSSLHRLDYGVSFGVAAGLGALAGLLTPWLRRPLLALFGGVLVLDLLAFTDPLTNWGHLIALATGIATWPVVRGRHRARAA
ncbi:rhomboid-like protein [Streptomyces sp. AC555_RSS877]|uniref:rhomboid-like protein n=1 Tax=Streptomyces sp. AC555_RSS877 TaxID=2823688 RepID=UPI0020B6A38F|nr:rhomboid-like protein [Streptomyces sp. AC555_RSS877]